MRVPAVLALLASLAVAVPGSAAGQAREASSSPAQGLGWRLSDLDGDEVSLAELTGRPLVVNVWATWCLPCVAEIRSLERLARSLEGEDVGFALVAPQERRAVADWVGRRGHALPFYVEATPMPDAFGLEALPTTWILDAEGRVVLKHRGALDWDRDDIRELLRRLAAGDAGAIVRSPP